LGILSPQSSPQNQPSNSTPAPDEGEETILADLFPPFADKVRLTLQKARAAGLNVYIFEGGRSIERQTKLYAQGRDAAGNVVDKKKVVTNAKPGHSYHNYYIAMDLVFDKAPERPGKQWTWDMPDAIWEQLGEIGESCGLRWLGNSTQFKEFPHFQLNVPGCTTAMFYAWYQTGGLTTVWNRISEQLGLPDEY
jgi:hypothetical protein